jgi:hypothetical protein
MSPDAHELAVRLGHAAAEEAPYTEDGLAGVIQYRLMKEGHSLKVAEALAEEAARAVFATLAVPTLLACEAEAALFGWANHKQRARLASPPPPLQSPLPPTAVGENLALF